MVKKVLGVTLKFRLMVLSVPVTQCFVFFTGTSSAIAHKVSASVTQRFASCHPGVSLLPVLCRPDGSVPCDTGCSLGESEESSKRCHYGERKHSLFVMGAFAVSTCSRKQRPVAWTNSRMCFLPLLAQRDRSPRRLVDRQCYLKVTPFLGNQSISETPFVV